MNGGKRRRGLGKLADRSPARRTGVMALALLFGSATAALLLAHLYQPGVQETAITLLVGGGTLPTLYLGWVTYRDSRVMGEGLTLAKVADELAIAVRAQWEAEAEMRRLNDPYPLPIRWVAADAALADGWEVLVTLATEGAGWLSPPPQGTWATSPDELAGGGSGLVNVLARVPTGRLVVLGGPGAGKTMLMIRLVLDLLARRASGGPVPVLCSLASWNPLSQDLHGWLAAQLTIDHPALAAAAPLGSGAGTRLAALLSAGLILPILDGLDEIPDAVRGPAITRINDALRPGEPLVVTCRTEQYRDTVRPAQGPEATLRAAAAVRLCQLDADAVSRYLRDDAGGPIAAARWDTVVAALSTQAPAGQALATPLMVGLARTIYNPRPGERAEALPDPAELCSLDLADRAAVESHLFDAFIPAAYRPSRDPSQRCRWTAQKAEKWLVFLARHQEQTIGSPDLAWWQLQQALPLAVVRLTGGLAAGLVVGLVFGQAAGLAAGVAFGLVTMLAVGSMVRGVTKPSRGMSFSIRQSASGLWGVLGVGLLNGFVAALVAGTVAGLVVGTVLGLVVWTVSGLRGVPSDLAAATSPQAVLARDRRAALVPGFIVVLAFSLSLGLVLELATWPRTPLAAWLAATSVATLVAALVLSMKETAWQSYVLARGSLAMRHRLPWPLMGFLADAHQRGVLRQAGAVYQFRHLELQKRLARRPSLKGVKPIAEQTEGTRLGRLITALTADSQAAADTLAQILSTTGTMPDGQHSAIQEGLQAWEPVIAIIVAASGGDRDAAANLAPMLDVLAQIPDWAALASVLRRILDGERGDSLLEGLDPIDTVITGNVLARLTEKEQP